MSSVINHLRSLLRLAESAQKAGDDELVGVALAAAEILAQNDPPIDMAPVLAYLQALTSRCKHCYMPASEDELARLRSLVMRELARHSLSLIEQNDQKVLQLPPMIRLVTALYVRRDGDITEGVSIAFVIHKTGALEFPRKGPLMHELQRYCADHQIVRDDIDDYWLPGELAGHRLMAGSVQVQQVLPEELQEMSW